MYVAPTGQMDAHQELSNIVTHTFSDIFCNKKILTYKGHLHCVIIPILQCTCMVSLVGVKCYIRSPLIATSLGLNVSTNL